jgi:origin recognition complex subunit 3
MERGKWRIVTPSIWYRNSTDRSYRSTGKVPTGFIVTGPNISSQELLFKQLSSRLKTNIFGPVTILRSGDASNMKSVLKQLIRDVTNQKPNADDEEGPSFQQDVSHNGLSVN